jgi:predicted transcriptional regulator
MTLAEAMRIIERHQRAAPVVVTAIARDMGLEVYTTNEWTEDISGMIRRDGERGGSSGYAIYVNGKHHENRRRFTIAHEIAHFVLHREFIGDGITDDALYRSALSSSLETQANELAANILMPWMLLNDAMGLGIDDVRALARYFNVSPSAMSVRLGVPYETA